MNAKQFGHFLSLQQQLAGLRRGNRTTTRTTTRSTRNAVLAAKDWLATAGRSR